MDEVKYQLKKFEDSLSRLREVVNYPEESEIVIDATIQRFEFTFEMAWKAIKKVLRYFGENCTSPRNCIKMAYSKGWIKDEEQWLNLLDARNKTSHTYNQALAEEVYKIIKSNVDVFDELLTALNSSLL